MRSLRVSKAPTLPTWLGNRVASSQAALAQIVEVFKQPEADPSLESVVGPALAGLMARTPHVQAKMSRPTRGVATFSTGGNGRVPGRRKDPALLLGAGWEGGVEDVAVAVWWDIENCNVPLGIEVYKVGVNIVSGLRMCGFKGPVSISAYGDTLQLSRSTQEALTSTGIQLHHIPSGGKDSTDRALLVDLLLWTFEHPPPAHLFLISGDRDFANALHRLRMMNYNILLACPAGSIVSPSLVGAATHVWQWNSLVRGEGLLLANSPPEGSLGGLGTSRQSVLSPYSPISLGLRGSDLNGLPVNLGGKPNPPPASSAPESPPVSPASPAPVSPPVSPASPPPVSPETLLKAVEGHSISVEVASKLDGAPVLPPAPLEGSKASEDKKVSQGEAKSLRQVPKEVLQQLQNLLVSHPNGIMLADLQTHLFTDKLSLERDFYGHGKIIPFLLSIPDIVQLERVLMKDNRSWTYRLTSTNKTAQGKQQKSAASAESGISTKASAKLKVQKTSKQALTSPELATTTTLGPAAGKVLDAHTPLKIIQAEVDLPSLSRAQIRSTEKKEDLSVVNHQGPACQTIPDSVAEPTPCLQKKTSEVAENLSQRESQFVDGKAPLQEFLSFLSPLMSMLKRWQGYKAVDSRSDVPKPVTSPSGDKTEADSGDHHQKIIVHPEEFSKELEYSNLEVYNNSVKVDVSNQQNHKGGLLTAEGMLQERFIQGGKGLLHAGNGGSDEKLEAVSEEVPRGEKPGNQGKEITSKQSSKILTDQMEGEDKRQFWRTWKTWLFGPTKDLAPSPSERSITENSTPPAFLDLSDLDKVTWKDLLSLPGKSAQSSTDSEAELICPSNNTIGGSRGEVSMQSSSTSETGKWNFDESEGFRGTVWEDLKAYLCSAEGSAILLKSPNWMDVVNTIRTSGPQEFRHLQSSQLSDFMDQLAKTEERFNNHLFTGNDVVSASSSDKRASLIDTMQAKPERQSSEMVDLQNPEKYVVPEQQGVGNGIQRRPTFGEEKSPNGEKFVQSKVMDQLLTNPLYEFPSSSKKDVESSKQGGEIRSLGNESLTLRAPGSMHTGPGSSTASSNETMTSHPSLGEFQVWFLKTVKESYKSSERTRKTGFNLGLVKPNFERVFRVRLDPKAFGFVKLQDLVASVREIRLSRPRHDICVVHLLENVETFEDEQHGETKINIPKVSNWPRMYHDCKSLVRELMLENPDGFDGAKLKPLFISRFQYPLDHKCVGYPRMSDLLRLMPDVVSVNGRLLVPSEELLLNIKNEAMGEVNNDKDLIVEDNGTYNTCLESEHDANIEKTDIESQDCWVEIDIEGNGSTSPFEDIGEVAPEDRPGVQDHLVYDSSASEEISIGKQVVAQDMASEAKSEGIAKCSLECEFPSVKESQSELLKETKDDLTLKAAIPPMAGSENSHSFGEPHVNLVPLVDQEIDGTSIRFKLRPPFSLSEAGGLKESSASNGDRDVAEDKKVLIVKKNQDGTMVTNEEALELPSASVVVTASSSLEGEEHIKSAPESEGEEPKPSGDNLRVLASTLQNTSMDVVSGGTDNEPGHWHSEGSEIPNTTEQKDNTFSASNRTLAEERVQSTLIENCESTQENKIVFQGLIKDELPNPELETSASHDEELPEDPFMPGRNVKHLSIKDSRTGFEGFVGDKLAETELKANSLTHKESSSCVPDGMNSLSEPKEDNLCPSSPSLSNDMAPTGTPAQRNTSELVSNSQSQQSDEGHTSEVALSHEDEKATTAAQSTHEGCKEGPFPESSSQDKSTLKSIWKRLFS